MDTADMKAAEEARKRKHASSIEGALALFQLTNRAEGKSRDTLAWYELTVGCFIKWMESMESLVPMGEVTEDHLRGHVIYLGERKTRRGHRLAKSSINTYVRGLRAFFRWAAGEGFTDENIGERVRPPKVPSKIIEILEDDEIELLMAYVSSSPRNYAIVLLFLDTGLRISELAGIEIADVNFGVGYVKVMGKGSKERIVPFGHETHQALYKYMTFHRPPVSGVRSFFVGERGQGLRKQGVISIFKALKLRTGIQRLHAHLLRHTYATNFLLAGGSSLLLKQNLGHTTMSMVDHYVHLASLRAVEVSREFSPIDRMRRKR
ncbi:MAG: tyrosine-type recombinase/integrase [Chloroflexi bacterium]|nr:tyrosine-type recombinase/integrase [Chloroflexota bacterium]